MQDYFMVATVGVGMEYQKYKTAAGTDIRAPQVKLSPESSNRRPV